ncbi:2-hydroxyacyl-CoA dehydratase family protein [Conexibacter sp. S30A1]|uniref:2-hydroxyacyl-CoA dehydratase family protein n=1 Tax=Conexibacter sp. S30A1 TaxID=2937800 RepID=UPI00200F4196|nr:2-hydroxyacyl-CoA dehydratase family protein [Conexibacter sp. S30A1]
MPDDHAWLGQLGVAYDSPEVIAERWRAGGGKVVGIFGRYAPRELVTAVGMLPVPLDPVGLVGADGRSDSAAPPGLRGELSSDAFGLVAALLDGRLGWIDALLIGRDSEAHTKLFYVLREMAADAEFGALLPPLAFSDVLRLPLRTSAVYNRIRLRELAAVLAQWAEREFDPVAVRQAITEDVLITHQLRSLRRLRAEGRITATEALIADVGVRTLPGADARSALAAMLAARSRPAEGHPPALPGPCVFITGSGPVTQVYSVLEESGLVLVGDDHESDGEPPGPDGEPAGLSSRDPIDWLADHCQFSTIGAARAGLDRVRHVARRVTETHAAGVLQLILPEDEASGWELAELVALLPDTPVISVELAAEGEWGQQLRDAAAALRARISRPGSGGEVLHV